MAVHHVDVDHAGAGGDYLVDLGAEPREVGGQDRRRDAAVAHQLGERHYTALSMLPWQWLQATIAVLDIRTIVECSPQLGHTDTSSKRCRQYTQR
jgi:hypothetical protein